MATTGGESLGTARLDLSVDTTDFEVAIERARSRQKGMVDEAQVQYQRLNKTERQRVDTLNRQVDTLGMTRQQQLAYNTVLKTSGSIQEDLLKRIQATNTARAAEATATQRAAIEVNKYGLSAKQQVAAMRQVPAQITDIFVSLAGGQNPMMVAIQQGGQLKDVFGGIRPAAAALGSQLMALINPFTVLAAVIGTVAVAAYQGSEESNAYGRALALTGNIAGKTVGDLQFMALSMEDINTTQAKAAEALTAVAASGKFAGDQFRIVAQAAVDMEYATGQSIDKTVDQFASLANDPVAAVAKLNAETHFLTEEIYKQIKALQEQGDEHAAATVAMSAYADAIAQRTSEVNQNIGILQEAWRGLGMMAKWAWDQMMNIGREDSPAQRIQELHAKLIEVENPSNMFSYAQLGRKGSEERKKYADQLRQEIWQIQDDYVREQKQANQRAAAQEANDYAIAQDRNIAAHRSADERRASEISRSRKEAEIKAQRAITAGNTDLAATIRANQQKYEAALNAEGAKKKGRSGAGAARALSNAESRADLQEFKDQLAEEQAAIRNNTSILQAQYSAKLISVEDYYSRTRELMQQDTAAQTKAIEGQIASLKSRNVTGKDSVDVQRQLHQLESQLARVRADGATAVAVLAIQEQEAAKKRQQAVDDYRHSLDMTTDAMKREWDATVAKISMGEQEYAQAQKLADIYRKQAEELYKLNVQKNRGDLTPQQYDQEVQALQQATDQQVQITTDGYQRMLQAQGDWRAGVRAGLQDWMANASDVAGQTRAIMVNSLDRVTDAFVEFALTGKMAWKQLLADILKEIVNFLMKQAILQFVKYFAGQWMGGSTGGDSAMLWNEGGMGGGGISYAAKGGVWASPSLSAYSNQVVDRPTPFYFAKGAGIFGEAGPEAIMPLTRGPDGNLGVRAHGGGASSVTVNVTTNVSSNGSQTTTSTQGEQAAAFKKFSEEMRGVAQEELQRSLRPGGTLWKAGVTVQ